VAGCN